MQSSSFTRIHVSPESTNTVNTRRKTYVEYTDNMQRTRIVWLTFVITCYYIK